MMQFRKTKKNLITILGKAARGRFRVVDHQAQVIDSTEILGDKRRVQVFFGEGDFSKGKSAPTGPTQHDVTYRVELAVSAATEVNLSVLNNVDATEAQRSAALKCFKSSSKLADDSLDELYDIVYQILMDGRNVDLGEDGPLFVVSDRWVDGFSKDAPVPQGEFVELTGSVRFSCNMEEQLLGDAGTTAGSGAINITNDFVDDDVEETGVIV